MDSRVLSLSKMRDRDTGEEVFIPSLPNSECLKGRDMTVRGVSLVKEPKSIPWSTLRQLPLSCETIYFKLHFDKCNYSGHDLLKMVLECYGVSQSTRVPKRLWLIFPL